MFERTGNLMNAKYAYAKAAVVALIIAVLTVPGFAREKKNHTIVKIMDLIEKADEAYWYNQDGETIGFNDKNLTHNSVYRDVKKGLFGVSEFSPDQSVKKMVRSAAGRDVYINTLDVELLNRKREKPAAVRGIYTLTLPQLKRIQLEVDYDEIISDPLNVDKTDFYIEVQEKDRENPSQWVSVSEIRQIKPKKRIESRRIFALTDPGQKQPKEMYTSHSYNAVLSNWAGQKVRIILAAKSQVDADTKIKGRWLNAKLVGATFDYKIVANE